MSTTTTTSLEQLLEFINGILPKIDRRERTTVLAEADTELFESGVIDSLAIIHLIAFIEQLTGHEIGHKMIVMKHFKTPRTIASTFLSVEI